MAHPPLNLVYVFGDQWRSQATGYAGDPNVHTPHLDALAKQAVVCTNAVANTPVCGPSRANLLTGRLPHSHGMFTNDVHLHDGETGMGKAFAAAGYDTAWIGKWHLFGHDRSAYIPPASRQGFKFWKTRECSHDYFNNWYHAENGQKIAWEGYDAAAQTQDLCRYLRDPARGAKPFAAFLSWGPPHNPYEKVPPEFLAQYDPEKLILRPNVPPEDQAQARKDLAGYYAHCTALDQCVGQILRTMDETGLRERTVFVFTADHGDMLGAHHGWRKQWPYDESILVPLIVSAPGLKPARRPAPISTVDMMPTLLGLCGGIASPPTHGHDFSASLCGTSPAPADGQLIACYEPFSEWSRARQGREYRGLRTEQYTYVRDITGPWLLFDDAADRYQQKNLINEPAHAALQQSLDKALQQELKRVGDDFAPGAEMARRWSYTLNAEGCVHFVW